MTVYPHYKEVLLKVAYGALKDSSGPVQEDIVLREAAQKLNVQGNLEGEQELLSAWQDIFQKGELAWGYNLENQSRPFFHRPR